MGKLRKTTDLEDWEVILKIMYEDMHRYTSLLTSRRTKNLTKPERRQIKLVQKRIRQSLDKVTKRFKKEQDVDPIEYYRENLANFDLDLSEEELQREAHEHLDRIGALPGDKT